MSLFNLKSYREINTLITERAKEQNWKSVLYFDALCWWWWFVRFFSFFTFILMRGNTTLNNTHALCKLFLYTLTKIKLKQSKRWYKLNEYETFFSNSIYLQCVSRIVNTYKFIGWVSLDRGIYLNICWCED